MSTISLQQGTTITLHTQKKSLISEDFTLHKESFVRIEKSVLINYREDYFEELWQLGEILPPTIHPQWKTTLLRKQATYGACYTFAKQKTTHILTEESEWPILIRMAMEDARSRVPENVRPWLNVGHVNWYTKGAGICPHKDDEDCHVRGVPIFSYSFGCDREMQIYDMNKAIIGTLQLSDGDLLIMGGKMQDYFFHGIKTKTSKKAVMERRINITIRSFGKKHVNEIMNDRSKDVNTSEFY